MCAREIRLEFRPVDTIIGSFVYVRADRLNDLCAGRQGALDSLPSMVVIWNFSLFSGLVAQPVDLLPLAAVDCRGFL